MAEQPGRDLDQTPPRPKAGILGEELLLDVQARHCSRRLTKPGTQARQALVAKAPTRRRDPEVLGVP